MYFLYTTEQNISVAYCLDEMTQIFQLHFVWMERNNFFSCIFSGWIETNISNISVAYSLDGMGQICRLNHCQVQMTSCDANPAGGEDGGACEAIPKNWDIPIWTKISKYEAIPKFKISQYRLVMYVWLLVVDHWWPYVAKDVAYISNVWTQSSPFRFVF